MFEYYSNFWKNNSSFVELWWKNAIWAGNSNTKKILRNCFNDIRMVSLASEGVNLNCFKKLRQSPQ